MLSLIALQPMAQSRIGSGRRKRPATSSEIATELGTAEAKIDCGMTCRCQAHYESEETRREMTSRRVPPWGRYGD